MTVQNRYIATVVKRAESSDTTVQVDVLPTDTSITSGYLTAIKSSPLSNVGVFIEELKFTGTNDAGGVLTLTGLLRGLREYGADTEVAANKKTLPAGTILIMGPNQHITNNKANLDSPNTFTGDQTITNGNVNLSNTYGLSADSDNIRIWNDGSDWQFKSNAQAQISLSALSSASGVNDKIKISAVDDTEGYGAVKFLGGDGISATDSGAGNSTLTFAVDITDTNVFVKDSSGSGDEDKVPVCDSSGKVTEFAFITGMVMNYMGSSAPSGWLLLNGDSIGDTGSGATHTGSSYLLLYTFLWDNLTDTNAPVSGGRGASALADWQADKTLTMPDASGRASVMLGGTAFSALGKDDIGAETHTLTAAQSGVAAHGHEILVDDTSSGGVSQTVIQRQTLSNRNNVTSQPVYALENSAPSDPYIKQNTAAGASQAHNNNQPSIVVNTIIKL